ncbi:MAG: PilT/PilU family type 4a pilus ATPase, partial [Candidatus Omnitrophica bacterium]|nr:PilT/PilU family type 4a pilus ATPase [Candidatus Omnitrophota bacterium]
EFGVFDASLTEELVFSMLTSQQQQQFKNDLELDLSFTVGDGHRVRVNVHRQRGVTEAAMRLVSLKIRTIQELGLPEIVTDMARKQSGLILVTGPTGVGKTTTLAAMVDLINSERECLMVTIEDPIEYVHVNKKSIVKQREVYSDTHSFAEALKRALRQDPNVIVVGELRDLETIQTALTAAETGHLVLATLHTPDAPQTIDRIVDVFPPYQQEQIRIQLAGCLQAVISQQLFKRIDGPGRVVATEILVTNAAIRNMIREGETEQIPNAIQTGGAQRMKSMDKSIAELFRRGLVSKEDALGRMKEPDRLMTL